MSMTDDNNPLCECTHLWSNHYQKAGMYFCEAPDCACQSFSERSPMDRFADFILLAEEDEITANYDIATDYDCERHGKGKGPDCPTCFMSDEKIRGRYIP